MESVTQDALVLKAKEFIRAAEIIQRSPPSVKFIRKESGNIENAILEGAGTDGVPVGVQ